MTRYFPKQLDVEEIQWSASRRVAKNLKAHDLAPYTRLRSLRFAAGAAVGESFIQQLLLLPNVTRLHFDICDVHLSVYPALWAHGKHLRVLDLLPSGISERFPGVPAHETAAPPLNQQGALHLLSLPHLESLSISGAGATDGLPLLLNSATLTSLSLYSFNVTEELLEMCCAARHLRTLRIHDKMYSQMAAGFTIEGVRHLTNLRVETFFLETEYPRNVIAQHVVAALGANTTIRTLSLYTFRDSLSCKPLAQNTTLTWLDISSGTWWDTKAFRENTTLVSLMLPNAYRGDAQIVQRIEENNKRAATWIRSAYLTRLILLAVKREDPTSPWSRLPMDLIRIIFGQVPHAGRPDEQMRMLVEYVWANVGEMWVAMQRARRGVRVLESLSKTEGRFRWEIVTTQLLPSPRATSGATAQPRTVSVEKKSEEKCWIQ